MSPGDTNRTEKQFLLQMSGWNGSGKSTLARAVGTATGSVVLDHDTTKSAILERVEHPPAGAVSYDVLFAVAADLLAQGHSVIIDSPCAYEIVLERGRSIAADAGVAYKFVACECPPHTADERVDARVALPSQVTNSAEARVIATTGGRALVRPADGWLAVETTRSLDVCVAEVLAYVLR